MLPNLIVTCCMYMQEQGAVGAQQYYEAHKVCRLMLSPVCCQSIKPISSLIRSRCMKCVMKLHADSSLVMGLHRGVYTIESLEQMLQKNFRGGRFDVEPGGNVSNTRNFVS